MQLRWPRCSTTYELTHSQSLHIEITVEFYLAVRVRMIVNQSKLFLLETKSLWQIADRGICSAGLKTWAEKKYGSYWHCTYGSRRLLRYCRNKQWNKTTSTIIAAMDATFIIFIIFNSFSLVLGLGYMSITVTMSLFSLMGPCDRGNDRTETDRDKESEERSEWTYKCVAREGLCCVWSWAGTFAGHSHHLCLRTK